jgi:hypothetical protein
MIARPVDLVLVKIILVILLRLTLTSRRELPFVDYWRRSNISPIAYLVFGTCEVLLHTLLFFF